MSYDAEINLDFLGRLIDDWENEVVEFKAGRNGTSGNTLGKYFSALANEANLRGFTRAWLVFGVDNKTRDVIGSNYKVNPSMLNNEKNRIQDQTGSTTFREIHVLEHPKGRVILFEIPAAPRGMPIACNGHHYGRVGESLAALGHDKLDEIRSQTSLVDWSAQIVEGATVKDLDKSAIALARRKFASRFSHRFSFSEIKKLSDKRFLDRARITQGGKITRAALLLIGKPEAAYHLSPNPAEITWVLEGEQRTYEHFSPPFLLTTSQVYERIRNITVRLLPADMLIPHDVSMYDQKIVLEAIHNCIAHQDYSLATRIIVKERPDRLIFENGGSFFERDPDAYALANHVPIHYRNTFLAQMMANLGMIDKLGYGIQTIYQLQRERFLPLPDYDLDESNLVRLTIHGRVVDIAYSQLLMQKTDLPVEQVLALDRIQKQLPVSDEAIRKLRKDGLIEGRKPHIRVSSTVTAVTEN